MYRMYRMDRMGGLAGLNQDEGNPRACLRRIYPANPVALFVAIAASAYPISGWPNHRQDGPNGQGE